MSPIFTAKVGTNADLFPDILKMYLHEGDAIADVTYGKGTFWKQVKINNYTLFGTDISNGVDLKDTGYKARILDGFVLDPPYGHSSSAPKRDGLAQQYNLNNISGREQIFELYKGGIVEAHRTLKHKGILIVKCQDEIESGKQHWNHVKIMNYAESNGFRCEDLFVLVQKGKPAMRHKHQIHARKNHSYFLVFRKVIP